jgi:hypothetical protein
MLRLFAPLLMIASLVTSCGDETEKDPKQVEFEKEFSREAVLVRTCPGDPTLASGPTAAAIKVYRFQQELWFDDRGTLRRVEATFENVCSIVTTRE